MEEARALIEKFHWNLEIVEGAKWYVMSGESVIFVGDAQAEVDVFIYGMALAYNGIPSPYFEQLVDDMDDWYRDIIGE